MNWKLIDHSNIKNDQYYISNKGDLKNIRTGKILKKSLDKDGYVVYKLPNRTGKIKTYKGHRLVAKSFLKRNVFNNGKRLVNHIDGNKSNNDINNLEWVDVKGNNKHADLNGLRDIHGVRNGNNVYTTELINNICLLIQDGYSNKDIILTLDIPTSGKSRTAKHALVSSIRKRKIWKQISNKYVW